MSTLFKCNECPWIGKESDAYQGCCPNCLKYDSAVMIVPMSESQTPRTDALKAQGIEWVPIGRMKDVESELAATRARLAELEGITERLYAMLGGDSFFAGRNAAIEAYEAYKEGKK